MITVIIADDHALFRSGISEIMAVHGGFNVLGEAASGGELIELLRQQQPDVLLMDMSMPGISGVELIDRVHTLYPSVPIVVLTMIDEAETALRAIKAGALGYITKNSLPAEMIEAVRKVAGGGKYIDRNLAERMLFDFKTSDELHHSLTDRELEIFNRLIQGKTVNEIASELCISNKTVSTHKVHVLEKMKMKSAVDLAKYAVHHGLMT